MEQDELDTIRQQDNTAYIARQQYSQDAVISQHLNTDEVLERLKRMLLGYEWNEEQAVWVESTIEILDENNQLVLIKQGPLMNPKDVRVTVGYLQAFLNPNTFLSQLTEDRINDIRIEILLKIIQFYSI